MVVFAVVQWLVVLFLLLILLLLMLIPVDYDVDRVGDMEL